MSLSKSLCVFLALTTSLCFAAPKQVVIVRHGDKLEQKKPGSVLSAKGQLRAIALAQYYLKTFGEPDSVIAAKFVEQDSDLNSLRPVLTVSPLVNMLTQKHPTAPVTMSAPYVHGDYKLLAKELLTRADYQNKSVLVCWEHHLIKDLAEALGVKEKIESWPSNDYDSVYILTFNEDGSLKSFTKRHNQYPVTFNGNWPDILQHH